MSTDALETDPQPRSTGRGGSLLAVGAVLLLAIGAVALWLRGESGASADPDGPTPHPELAGALERAQERFPDLQKRRIVLLGMDSCDPGLVDRLIRQGKLPHFARLKREGAYGELRSIQPVLSPVVWTTISTGMPPERHGIMDFVTQITEGRVPVSSRMRQADTIWELLARNGHSVGVVGWLVTYPADPLENALIVTERVGVLGYEYEKDEVRDAKGRTYPEDLADRYKAEKVEIDDMPPDTLRDFAEYTDEEYGAAYTKYFTMRNLLGNLRLTMATAETFRNMGLRMLREERPRFMACYFEAMDALSHWFMPYHPPQMKTVPDELFRRYSRTMEANYVWHDKVLGEFMDACDEDTTLILVSDHGFRSGELRLPDPSDFRAKTGAQWHRNYGVIFAWGQGVKGGHEIRGATVYDVAPTVLAAMGMPVSDEMDRGRVLGEIFAGGLEYERVPSYYGRSRRDELLRAEVDRKEGHQDLTPEQLAELQRLQALGYIGGATSDPATTNLNAGNRYLLTGQAQLALQEFERALEKRRDPRVLVGVAAALTRLGRLDEAQKHVDEALGMAPDDSTTRLLHARLMELRRDLVGAEKEIRAVVKHKPHNYGALSRLGNNLLAQAKLKEDEGDDEAAVKLRLAALDAFTRSLDREPLQPDVLRIAARLRLELHQDERLALELLDKAVRLYPDHFQAHNNRIVARLRLGILAKESGDRIRAKEYLNGAVDSADEALRLRPKYPKAWANKAYALWQLDRLDDAEQAVSRAREIHPGYVFDPTFLAAMKAAGREIDPPATPKKPL